MRKWLLIMLVIGLFLVSTCGTKTEERSSGGVARAVLFWSETCPHCHQVLNETLPLLQEKYGKQLEIRTIELSDPASRELWAAALETYQVPPERQGVPMLFIGDQVLVGSYEIPDQLPRLIEQYLAAGGVDYPEIPGL